MIWISLAAIVMSGMLIKLGALSVLVVIQAIALKAALVVTVFLALAFIWRWLRG